MDMDLEDKKKLQLIGFTSQPISVLHKQYSDVLLEYILTNNFDDNDESYLFENYSDYQGRFENDLSNCNCTSGSYYDDKMILDDQLLSEIIVKSSLTIDEIELWSLALPRLNEEICKKHFDELGLL